MSERNLAERPAAETSYAALQTVSTGLQQTGGSPKSQLKSSASSQASNSANVEEECARCLEVVHKKLVWARMALESERDPNVVTSYLKAITSCVEAITVLRKFSS